jgi:hypothetical protein
MTAFNHTRGKYEKPGNFILPDGYYEIECTVSNFTDNNAGTGKVLKLTFDILEGEYANRKHFDNLNLIYPEEWAVNNATNTLNGILEAVGMDNMTDTDQLLGKKLCVEVINWISKQGKKGQTFIYHPSQTRSPMETSQPTVGSVFPNKAPDSLDKDIPF